MLCVPDFHHNLISLGEIVKTSKCNSLFHFDQCDIQDSQHGKMIGMARLKGGLYHLVKPIVSPKTIININACNNWHARLGHASSAKIKFLHDLDSIICVDKVDICE